MKTQMTTKQYKETTSSETKEQIALAQLLDQVKYQGRPLKWMHCPNESKRNIISGANLKKAGMKKGFPDFIIFDSPPIQTNIKLKGAVIELKRLAGGKLSKEQEDWINFFDNNNWAAAVAEGMDEAILFLREWGYIK
jgi:hypothetical protein